MAGPRLLIIQLAILGVFSSVAEIAIAKPFTGFGYDIDSYIQTTAKRYQVSEHMLRGLVKMEDGWLNKSSPTGARGVGQFTVRTWNWLASTAEGQALGMRIITPRNRGTIFDPRNNKRINTLAIGALARWHITRFQDLGIHITDENLYMAHNIGLDGLHRALLGKSTKEDIRNMRLNGMKAWMTVKDFMTYQKGRYNTNKFEANFIQPAKSYVARTIRWVEPAKTQVNRSNSMSNSPSSQMKWVEPTSTMAWINPTN